MIHPIESEFVFALVNPGSEQALKLETRPLGWRPSYQRRGFVTFKADAAFSLEELEVPLACARRLCLSLGKAATREDAVCLLEAALGAVPLVHHARYAERQIQGVHEGGGQAGRSSGNSSARWWSSGRPSIGRGCTATRAGSARTRPGMVAWLCPWTRRRAPG
ncbi:MAG: hypothetical protein WCJ14_02085 [Verrucomicrobiota bacterium]